MLARSVAFSDTGRCSLTKPGPLVRGQIRQCTDTVWYSDGSHAGQHQGTPRTLSMRISHWDIVNKRTEPDYAYSSIIDT